MLTNKQTITPQRRSRRCYLFGYIIFALVFEVCDELVERLLPEVLLQLLSLGAEGSLGVVRFIDQYRSM